MSQSSEIVGKDRRVTANPPLLLKMLSSQDPEREIPVSEEEKSKALRLLKIFNERHEEDTIHLL